MKKCIALWDAFSPALAAILLFCDFCLIFLYAPEEAAQGAVQKTFYFHVASAFSMYAAFLASGIAAAAFLRRRRSVFNAVSHAGASVGTLFCAMVLASGPIWAKPVWGTWWTWDPRLTTTLMLFLIFAAVLLLREFYGPDPRGRVYAAVLTLFGLLDIPIIVLAVKLWRGAHPSVLGKEGNMPGEMKVTLFFTLFTLLFLAAFLTRLMTRQIIVGEGLEELLENAEDS